MTIHLRSLSPQPTTFDPSAHTVEAILSTGADVQRGGSIERLPLENADLSRMIGAPVLDAHNARSTRDQLGVVEAAEIRPEGLWVRIRFRSNPSSASRAGRHSERHDSRPEHRLQGGRLKRDTRRRKTPSHRNAMATD